MGVKFLMKHRDCQISMKHRYKKNLKFCKCKCKSLRQYQILYETEIVKFYMKRNDNFFYIYIFIMNEGQILSQPF